MGSGRSSGARHPRQVAALIESHFGESASLSVGIEEELMILDAETLLPAGAVDVLVRESSELDLPGRLKTELHASVVELNTGICADVGSAVDALRALRVAAAEIATANGLAIAGAGAHPTATYDSLPVVQEERYLAMMRDVGFAARRQGVNGLLVPSGDANAMADALWMLLRSPSQRAALAQRGREIVAARFTFAAQARRYERLFARWQSAAAAPSHREEAAPC